MGDDKTQASAHCLNACILSLGESSVEMLDEIVSEFLVESHESLDQLDRDLMALEEAPEDRDRMSSIFRTIHTIKGTSGFLAFPKLERLAHVGENLLVPLRDGKLSLSNEIADSLLAMVDGVRSMLGSIENGAGEGDDSYEPLIAQLEALKNGTAPLPTTEIEAQEVIDELAATNVAEAKESEQADKKSTVRGEETEPADVSSSASPVQTPSHEGPQGEPESSVSAKQLPGTKACVTKEVKQSGAKNVTTAPEQKSNGNTIADSTVRIDVHLLDKLMNLVGELVLARNQIMQYSQDSENSALVSASQRVNLITTELQEGVMKTRMQPIRNAWSKLPRVVRDLSHGCGKNVQVKMEGANTELDKTILEAIKDPLTHIVRNSVDHGIEAPDIRQAAGKPAEGTLLLRAYHEGGQVNIEIIDDGAGINVDRIRTKAVEKELITEDQAMAMSDRDAVQLILLPGFSTAQQVTNVSGRGVGMDVVKTNVEKIGGTLDIQSVHGQGTTLRIRIPLTLAIVPALVVTCGGDRYCIPQVSLLELVRLEGDRVRKEVETLHSAPVYRLRGQLLPLVYLDEELGLRSPRTEEERGGTEPINIVVLQAEDRQFGLVVDEINDTQEIVVKPLGQHLKNLAIYAGSTIMGDGAVALILDVIGTARKSHVLSEHVSRQLIDNDEANDTCRLSYSYLIVEPDSETRIAISLATVARLEEIKTSDIERSGHQQVVQYRGEIMPLVPLSEYGQIESEDGVVSLVVFNSNGRNIGVAVGRIVDIVNHTGTSMSDVASDTQIIDGRVTQVVRLSEVTAGV